MRMMRLEYMPPYSKIFFFSSINTMVAHKLINYFSSLPFDWSIILSKTMLLDLEKLGERRATPPPPRWRMGWHYPPIARQKLPF